jgi:hypothetical protein
VRKYEKMMICDQKKQDKFLEEKPNIKNIGNEEKPNIENIGNYDESKIMRFQKLMWYLI